MFELLQVRVYVKMTVRQSYDRALGRTRVFIASLIDVWPYQLHYMNLDVAWCIIECNCRQLPGLIDKRGI